MSVSNLVQQSCARAGRQKLNPIRCQSTWSQRYHSASRHHIITSTINQHKRLRLSASCTSYQHTRSAATVALLQDRSNPPASTRSAPLTVPERGSDGLVTYMWNMAKAYGNFYKTGVKAIFSNRKLAQQIRERLAKETGIQSSMDIADSTLLTAAVANGCVTRAEYQLLKRNYHDMIRVPLFGILVLLMGEWLVFIVPFMPYMPPLTCRIPSVINTMRDQAEQRRSWAFRAGIQEPDTSQQAPREKPKEQKPQSNQPHYGIAEPQKARQLVQSLDGDQLYHLACTLNLHSIAWERVKMSPPSPVLKRRLTKKLTYLTQDDVLLSKDGGADKLVPDELAIACEERGLNVLHPSEQELRTNLQHWLDNQAADNGSGSALLRMLFRR